MDFFCPPVVVAEVTGDGAAVVEAVEAGWPTSFSRGCSPEVLVVVVIDPDAVAVAGLVALTKVLEPTVEVALNMLFFLFILSITSFIDMVPFALFI